MKVSSNLFLSRAVLAALMFAPAASSAITIFSESFSGASVNTGSLDNQSIINGLTGGTVQWAANGFATESGILNTGQFEGSAVLDFIPETGNIYTLSLDVTSSSSRWIGLGFSTNGPTEDGAGDSLLNAPGQRFVGLGGRSWFLYRPDAATVAEEVQIFGGPDTDNGIADTDTDFDAAFTGVRNLSVILDTTADATGATYQADFLIDGVSLLSGGPATINADISTIGHVGFTFEGPAGGGVTEPITVDNFLLEQVPEPSSAALLGLGGLALILRRHK